jgi:DNA-binding IclR family transcriptional regulator
VKRLPQPQSGPETVDKLRNLGAGHLQGIARGALVLRLLARHPQGLTLREMVRLTDMPLATVQRVVSALNRENLVISVSRNGGVRLGPGLIPLAAVAKQFDLAEIVRPTLMQLVRDADETVDFSLLDHDRAVVVEQVCGTHELRAVSILGDSLPLYCTASGKAVLAAIPDEELRKLRRRLRLTPFTKNTIATWEQLDREIAEIRRLGLAFDHEEHRYGIGGVAVAFHAPMGEIGGVGIKVPMHRFQKKQKSLAKALLEQQEALQKRLLR